MAQRFLRCPSRTICVWCGYLSGWESPRSVSRAVSLFCAAAWSRWFANSGKCGPSQAEPLDIAITTNGHLLADLAQPLADAGLSRVTVSMDAVEPQHFARITRVPNGYERVLAGIRAAQRAGLNPVKVNCVLLRGFNDDQIAGFGKFAREEGVVVRFIEFMPLEEDRVWSPEIVITLDEVLRRMAEFMPLRQIEHGRSETARRYVFEDGIGEIGIIAPVSQPFCGACSRIRVTSDGKIRTCLFSVREHDLAGLMSRGASDEELVRIHHRRGGPERSPPPYRRAGLCARLADHGPHRRLGRNAGCDPGLAQFLTIA